MGNYYQGKYTPDNKEKYLGNPDNITFRSSWEFRAFKYCDNSPKVIKWASEEDIIPYISPLDKRMHRYFMDLKVVTIDEYGKHVITLIEIKPDAETRPPVKKGKKKERYLQEVKTYIVNQAKWAAARSYCAKRGWNFAIWTEKNLLPENDSSVKQLKAQRGYEEKMKRTFKKKKSSTQLLAIQRAKGEINKKLSKDS